MNKCNESMVFGGGIRDAHICDMLLYALVVIDGNVGGGVLAGKWLSLKGLLSDAGHWGGVYD